MYILSNEAGRYYIGSTNDLGRRLHEHSRGDTQTTRQQKIDCLVFKQEFKTLIEARRVEGWLKKLKRKDYVEKIIKDGYIKKAI